MNTNQKEYDVIVVGSGPGGATVARDMAKKGKKVLILERGNHARLKGSFWQYILYQCIPFFSMLFTRQLVAMVRGLISGGSSVFYYGTSFPVPYDMLESYGVNIRDEVDELRKEIPIAPLSDDIMGPKAKRIMKSARELGYNWKKLDKFMDQDRFDSNQHPAEYYYGDPRNVKWSARVFLKEALDHGADMITRAKVQKVLMENGKAIGVVFSRWGRKRTVTAPHIVIAAGGIGSPLILRQSGIHEAGNDFFFDPLISVVGYIDGIETRPEIPMSAGIHFDDEGYVMTDMALPKMIDMAFTASAFRFHRVFSQKKAVRIMIKIRDDLGGQLGGWGGIRKTLTQADKQKLDSGYKKAREILKNAGAKGIYKTWKLAAHPGGTVKLGELVDQNLETRIKNLYVCDCSVIPRAWGLPPTMTILGLARKLSNHLLDRRSSSDSDYTPANAWQVNSAIENYSDLVAQIVATREIRSFAGQLTPGILNVWAGNAVAKRAITGPLGQIIARGFDGDKALANAVSLSDLLSQERFVTRLVRELPGLLDGALSLVRDGVHHLEDLPAEKRNDLIAGLFTSRSNELSGDIITSVCRIIQSVHTDNPLFLAEHLGPFIRRWMESVDFGELKDAVTGSKDGIDALVSSMVDTLMNYPSKLVVLVSLIPDGAEILMRTVRSILAGLNRLSPDLLTDVVLSQIRDLDSRAVGDLVNEITEIVRKIHTGSALLGEPNNPKLPIELRRQVNRILASVDTSKLLTALTMGEQLADTVKTVVSTEIERDPELRKAMVHRDFSKLNNRSLRLNKKAAFWEDMLDEGEFTPQMNKGLKDIDPGEWADGINRILMVINEAREEDPRILRGVLNEFVSTLDTDEIGRTAQWLSKDLMPVLKPLAREVAAPFARELAMVLQPETGDSKDPVDAEVSDVSSTLLAEEA